MIPRGLSEMLTSFRLKRGLTQKQVAHLLRMALHSYRRYEKGKEPSARLAAEIGVRLSQYIKVTPLRPIVKRPRATISLYMDRDFIQAIGERAPLKLRSWIETNHPVAKRLKAMRAKHNGGVKRRRVAE